MVSSSSTMVTMSTAVPGAIWAARRVASTPEAPGRLMSMSTTSGAVSVMAARRLLGGAGGAGHLYPGQGGEQPGQAVAEDGMVIDDEDPGHAGTAGMLGTCAGAVTAGSRAWTVTPGEPSRTVTVPPSSSARSRMMARP